MNARAPAIEEGCGSSDNPEIEPPDHLIVQPENIVLDVQGGETSAKIEINNQNSEKPVEWFAVADVPWLELNAGEGETPSNLVLSFKDTGLAPGTHVGTIKIDSPRTNQFQDVPVEIIIDERFFVTCCMGGRFCGQTFTLARCLEAGGRSVGDCGQCIDPLQKPFIRADVNGDGAPDVSDGVFILNYLFIDGQKPSCMDAADANDSGIVDISDTLTILFYLFGGADAPPSPGPFECGSDLTEDSMNCADSFCP